MNIEHNSHKVYVTKPERRQFLLWLIDKYGYDSAKYYSLNIQSIVNQYFVERGIHVTQISAYRWTRGNNKQKYLDEVLNTVIDKFINDSLLDISA